MKQIDGCFFTRQNRKLFRYSSMVFAASLVVCMLLGTTVAYAAVTVNRTSSTYSDTSPYRSYMQNKMNCYGYAIHVYYPSGSSYKQQPGEFAYNEEEFQSLMQSYYWAMTYWNNMYYFVKDRVFEDFPTLEGWGDDDFSITETTRTAYVPSGQRKIAMSIRQDGANSDYHFYFRHDNGYWSHKPGSTAITDKSIDSNVTITDADILTTSAEGGYDDGTRYFLITKAAVVDFPHNYGHYSTTEYTTLDFRDKAGDEITKSYTIENSWNSRFDYHGDKDYFKFTSPTTHTYRIATDRDAGYDIDGAVFDSDGVVIDYDYSSSNADFYVDLTADETYYIYMDDYNEHTGYYILWCYEY